MSGDTSPRLRYLHRGRAAAVDPLLGQRDHEPAIHPWFMHAEMLGAVFGESACGRLESAALRLRIRGRNPQAYARELERWLGTHDVPALEMLLASGSAASGMLTWTEQPFSWSDVAHERRCAGSRSSFQVRVPTDADSALELTGTFNPARLTCSTSGVELAGTRTQWMLAQIAHLSVGRVELRPLAIATRLLAPSQHRWDTSDWQRIPPREVEQFASVDWDLAVSVEDLRALRDVPEATVKSILARILGEPIVPKDWGGEQADLWTSKLRVGGEELTAAFLLKGPARFQPLTIRMLGVNGDQIERLGRTAAEVLVVQHCHAIRPEVYSLLRSIASDFRNVRRYMLIDGFDTYRLLRAAGLGDSVRAAGTRLPRHAVDEERRG